MVYMQCPHELEIKYLTWMGLEPCGKLAKLWTHNPESQGSSPIQVRYLYNFKYKTYGIL